MRVKPRANDRLTVRLGDTPGGNVQKAHWAFLLKTILFYSALRVLFMGAALLARMSADSQR
jgi:hypothetical protein